MPDLAPAHPFDAQFDDPAELADIIHSVKHGYLWSLAYSEEDPVQATLDGLLEEYEDFDPMPTREDVERLVAPHMEEIEADLPAKRREIKEDELADRYFELRREGRTVASIARTLGEEPTRLAHIVSRVQFVDAKQQSAELAHKIRVEDARAKAYRARMRLLSKLTRKVETALEKRDFSDVPSDKLVDIMLRMADLTKEDTPPRPVLTVRNQPV